MLSAQQGAPPRRRCHRPTCSASADLPRRPRGFGPAPPPPPPRTERVKSDAAAVEAALRLANGGRPDVRPIDPEEAARGRTDYATVSSWTDANIEAVTAAAKARAGGGAPPAPLPVAGPPPPPVDEPEAPFYEALARRLAALEARGELRDVAAPPSPSRPRPLPPFPAWRMTEAGYAQHLCDVTAVHAALETAAQASAAPLLAWLCPGQGLSRAAQAAADYAAWRAWRGRSRSVPSHAPSPPIARAVARITALAATAAADAAPAARLAAHGYAAHMAQASLLSRAGAKAAEQLPLAQAGALAVHAHYPDLRGDEAPLARLRTVVDALGRALPPGSPERAAFFEELPVAVAASAALWASLATA